MLKGLVFFDLDSTLCKLEGLDYLAELKGVGEKVRQMTFKAMNGDLDYEKVMKIKMDLLRPSKQDLLEFSKKYLENITPGASEVVESLKKAGIKPFIITGNFRQPALAVARKIGIDDKDVFANEVIFDEKGEYKTADFSNPLFKTEGKRVVVQSVLANFPSLKSFFVGDGSTDLAVKGVVDYFIGFGGIVVREKVKKGSDFYVYSLKEVLETVLKFV